MNSKVKKLVFGVNLFLIFMLTGCYSDIDGYKERLNDHFICLYVSKDLTPRGSDYFNIKLLSNNKYKSTALIESPLVDLVEPYDTIYKYENSNKCRLIKRDTIYDLNFYYMSKSVREKLKEQNFYFDEY